MNKNIFLALITVVHICSLYSSQSEIPEQEIIPYAEKQLTTLTNNEIPALEPCPNPTATPPFPKHPVITEFQSNEQDFDNVRVEIDDYDENNTEEDTSDSEFDETSSDNQNSHYTGYHSIDDEESILMTHGQFHDYENMEPNSEAEKSEFSENATDDDEQNNEEYNTARENEYLSDSENSIPNTKKSVEASHSTEQANSESSNLTDKAATCEVNLDAKGMLNSESSQTNKTSLPTTTDLLAYIAKNGDLSLLSFIDKYKKLYSSETECIRYCHRLLHDAYDNHHAELMSAIKQTISSVNSNRIPSSTDIEYDNEIKSYNEFFTTICKEALNELPLRSLHANPNDYNISPNFFKRHSLTLTAAAVITVASAYYAYNYWHASEATDTVSAQ